MTATRHNTKTVKIILKLRMTCHRDMILGGVLLLSFVLFWNCQCLNDLQVSD